MEKSYMIRKKNTYRKTKYLAIGMINYQSVWIHWWTLKTASKNRVFLSTDRCSLPESKRSVVIVKTCVSVRMMRNELSILSRWFSYLGQCSKSCLFGKVTYVTTLIWTYIPYMIHQCYHHTPRTWTTCSNRTQIITTYVINLSNTFTCN